MAERPMLMSAPMVRAILAGTKTQTRRVVKPQPDSRPGMNCTRLVFKDRRGRLLLDEALEAPDPKTYVSLCPYGACGDRLWVREAFIHEPADYCWEASVSIPCRPATTAYRADAEDPSGGRWTPSIHMPRSLSRITLEITGVRVERLQAISEADAIAEGIEQRGDGWAWYTGHNARTTYTSQPLTSYRSLWESINGLGSWDVNPWVWVVEFKKAAG